MKKFFIQTYMHIFHRKCMYVYFRIWFCRASLRSKMAYICIWGWALSAFKIFKGRTQKYRKRSLVQFKNSKGICAGFFHKISAIFHKFYGHISSRDNVEAVDKYVNVNTLRFCAHPIPIYHACTRISQKKMLFDLYSKCSFFLDGSESIEFFRITNKSFHVLRNVCKKIVGNSLKLKRNARFVFSEIKIIQWACFSRCIRNYTKAVRNNELFVLLENILINI